MPTHDPIAQARQHIEKALIEKAMADSAFREELKANPHAAIKSLLGTDPIPGMKITVVEETPGEAILVLPRSIAQDELPDELLDFASGGTGFSNFIIWGPPYPDGGSCKKK
ncbi:NHLP leader peptide family RiPP precursor [Pannonibacter sp. Pt2-lr]|uniref:NHLP leader peptide family RiPP n=1 Tax=Pannonibacter anstelovis TaxID=3121537 RepID=A0ABU7ZRV7_9HYPH